MLSPGQLANPKYGVLYLPTVTFLYLWTIPVPSPSSVFQFLIPNAELYPFFAAIAYVGAIVTQNLFVAIFGPEGPEENPKHKTTALKHTFAILMNIDSDSISESSMTSVPNMIREFKDSVELSNGTRGFLLMIPVYALRLLFLYSIVVLTYYVWSTGGNFALILLFLGTTTIYSQKFISGLFPTTGVVDSAEYLDIPEYKRFEKRLSESQTE